MTARPDYTPALWLRVLTPLYDTTIAAFTREGAWRPGLATEIAPPVGMRIVEIGCGTATFTRAPRASAGQLRRGDGGRHPSSLRARRGARRRAGDGGEWERLHPGFDGRYLLHFAADPQAPGRFFAATQHGELIASQDGGRSWRQLGTE